MRRRKTEEDDTSNKDQEGAAAMFFLQIKPWRRVWPARGRIRADKVVSVKLYIIENRIPFVDPDR